MFTKNISITEKIESHINTSSDENGEDDSFEANGKDEFINPNIDELKSKIERYNYQKNKIQNKLREIQKDKTTSLWRSVYYIFFGNSNTGAVTLHELNLRCKFLFNLDKAYGFEKEIEKKKIKPLTNIEQFIRNYSLKKESNLLLKIFSDKKDKEVDEDTKELQRRIRLYNSKKQKSNSDIHNKDNNNNNKENTTKENKLMTSTNKNENLTNNKQINNNNIKNKTMNKSKSCDYIDATLGANKEVPEKRHYLKTLLELNDFNLQDEELFDIIQELNNKYKENGDIQKQENLSKIIKGDFIYKQELDAVTKKTNWINDPFLNECNYILDANSERQYLINHIDVDLISKYEHSLGPQDRMSRQINNFVNKILSKLNPNYKVDI